MSDPAGRTLQACHALLTLPALPLSWLYYVVRNAVDDKYRFHYVDRLGLRFPAALDNGKRPIWIHALSVGEALSSISLVHALRRRFPNTPIVFSVSTRGGYHVAERRLGEFLERIFFMPHDFPHATWTIVHRLRPCLFIQVETDVWPGLLMALRRSGVTTLLVNARLSPTSFRRLHSVRPLARGLYELFHHLFAQSESDARRFRLLGITGTKIQTAGNLKYEQALFNLRAADGTSLPGEIELDGQRPVWIAGSTHPGEEEIILEIHDRLRRRIPDLLLILAPRHPERAAEVGQRFSQRGFRVGYRSKGDSVRGRNVFIVDTLGELARFYAVGHVAFIGGSLVPFGGHNPLEAAVHGVPCTWGRHLFNFREIERNLVKVGGARTARDGQELFEILLEWLLDPVKAQRSAERTRSLIGSRSCVSLQVCRLAARYLDP